MSKKKGKFELLLLFLERAVEKITGQRTKNHLWLLIIYAFIDIIIFWFVAPKFREVRNINCERNYFSCITEYMIYILILFVIAIITFLVTYQAYFLSIGKKRKKRNYDKNGRIINPRVWGFRFLGNKSKTKMEVHDLYKENINCNIDKIKDKNKYRFIPDTLEKAHEEDFDNCAYCIGKSKR